MSGIACGATTMRVDPGMTCNGGSQQASNGGSGVGLMSGGGGSHNGPGNLVQDNNNQVLPQPSLECHTNGTNGEAVQPWKLLSHDTAKMNKLGEIVDSTASCVKQFGEHLFLGYLPTLHMVSAPLGYRAWSIMKNVC